MPHADEEERKRYQQEYRQKHKQHLVEQKKAARHKFRAENPLPPRPPRQEKTKEQHAAEMRQWRAENKERYRQWHKEYRLKNRDKINDQKRGKSRGEWLVRLYGMSLDTWNAMLIAQSGRCAICNDSFHGKNDPHVDHDHSTGSVRELLCTHCNTGIGYFKESPKRMQLAIDYLRRNGKE